MGFEEEKQAQKPMDPGSSASSREDEGEEQQPQQSRQPRKPSSTVINNLFAIAACSSKINEIKEYQNEIENEKRLIDENFIFQRKCQQMSNDLEAERKSHAEELRLINQDINHLEDMMKGIKTSHEQQRAILRQKYAAFKAELLFTNQLCIESGLTKENLIPFDSIPIPEWLMDKPSSSAMIPPPIFPGFPGSSQQQFFPNPMQPSLQQQQFRSPLFSNYFFPPPSTSATGAFGNIQPRPFNTFLEDISKLKNCQSCNQKIHRNAPVCPLCKSKNSSKAKKQKRFH